MSKKKNYRNYPFMNLSLKDLPGEKWKDIEPFEGHYKISNYGRIWALPRLIALSTGQVYFTQERIRKQYMASRINTFTGEAREQLQIHLRYENQDYNMLVNRLVYHYFVKPINFEDDRLRVVHIDGDNCNNHVDNLRLMNGTQLYVHDLTNNRKPKTSSITNRNGKKWSVGSAPRGIVKYTLQGKKIKTYVSIHEAAVENKVHRSSIRSVATRKAIQLNGFVYRYSGDPYRGEHAGFSFEKMVTQYSIEGKKLKTYPSVTEAAQITGIDANTISKAALGKYRLGSGYVWRYEGGTYQGELKGKIKNRSLPVIQYSLEGKIMNRYPSMNAAMNATGFSSATLADCAYRRTKVSHGYVWRFEGDSYKGEYLHYRRGLAVTQCSRDKKILAVYPTVEEAARVTGLTSDNILKNVHGNNKTAGGFVWRKATAREIQKLPVQKPEKSVPKPIKRKIKRSRGMTVTQYSMTGEKLGMFVSTKEAERVTGVHASLISSVILKKLLSTGGYIWKEGNGPAKINVEVHMARKKKTLKRMSKPVIQRTIVGKFISSYPSISAASRAVGIPVNGISSVVNGQANSSGGYLWELK
jgi:hypothetical protein